MAENYTLPAFQDAFGPKKATATSQTSSEQYTDPAFQKAFGSGQGEGQGGGQQQSGGSGWGIDWNTPWSQGGPSLKQPQSFQDFSDVASNEAFMNSLPALRARAEAARTRLGPIAAGGADALGSAVSPSQLFNLVGGPEVAAAIHEGLRSYNAQPNWIPTAPAAEKIGEDAAFGGVTGRLARMGGAAAPNLTRAGVLAAPIGVGTGLHYAFGHGDTGKEFLGYGGSLLGAVGFHEWLNDISKGARDAVANTPGAKEAIRSLILGGGSALRNEAGPFYNQWIPSQ